MTGQPGPPPPHPWHGPTYGQPPPGAERRASTSRSDGDLPRAELWDTTAADSLVAARGSASRAGRFSRVHSVLSVALPWQLARVLFGARELYPVRTGQVTALNRARGILGAIIVLGAIVRYDPRALLRYPTDTVNATSNVAVIAIGLVLLTSVVTLVIVQPHLRLRAARALLRPITTIAILIGITAGLVATRLVAIGTTPPPPGTFWTPQLDMSGGAEQFPTLLLIFAMNGLGVWLLIFLAVSTFLVAGNLFAVGDAHPRLVPVVTILVTVTLLGLQLIDEHVRPVAFLLDVSEPLLPADLALALQVGGTVTVITVAAIEFVALGRRGSGGPWRLRSGPWL